jgi:hypothetical protein
MENNLQERLSKIESQQERILTLLEGLTEKLRAGADDAAAIERMLLGHNGTPGLVIRLDRLEQSAERSRWGMRLLAGIVLTLAAGSVWAAL